MNSKRSSSVTLLAYLVWSVTASALVVVHAKNLNHAKRLAN